MELLILLFEGILLLLFSLHLLSLLQSIKVIQSSRTNKVAVVVFVFNANWHLCWFDLAGDEKRIFPAEFLFKEADHLHLINSPFECTFICEGRKELLFLIILSNTF
jgi:hypothetical protein